MRTFVDRAVSSLRRRNLVAVLHALLGFAAGLAALSADSFLSGPATAGVGAPPSSVTVVLPATPDGDTDKAVPGVAPAGLAAPAPAVDHDVTGWAADNADDPVGRPGRRLVPAPHLLAVVLLTAMAGPGVATPTHRGRGPPGDAGTDVVCAFMRRRLDRPANAGTVDRPQPGHVLHGHRAVRAALVPMS
jgi:hypothetical protein